MWKLGYFYAKLYSRTVFALEMVYYCCFSLGGNLGFLDFLQKKFYNINYRTSRIKYERGDSGAKTFGKIGP